jgi:hypothetical protein
MWEVVQSTLHEGEGEGGRGREREGEGAREEARREHGRRHLEEFWITHPRPSLFLILGAMHQSVLCSVICYAPVSPTTPLTSHSTPIPPPSCPIQCPDLITRPTCEMRSGTS